MTDVKTYVRSNAGWWTRNATYKLYMAREVSSFFLFFYALTLLVGLLRVSQGAAAFDAWRASLANPFSLLFHVMAFAFALVHTVTWFMVMPKTMPKTQFSDRQILAGGLAVSGALSLAFLLVAAWWGVSS